MPPTQLTAIAGILILLVGGGFFFHLAYKEGWLTPVRQMILGALFGVAMIGAGQWSLRRRMRLYAAGLIGAGGEGEQDPGPLHRHRVLLLTQTATPRTSTARSASVPPQNTSLYFFRYLFNMARM